jgi:hypothetical protein
MTEMTALTLGTTRLYPSTRSYRLIQRCLSCADHFLASERRKVQVPPLPLCPFRSSPLPSSPSSFTLPVRGDISTCDPPRLILII